MLQKRQGNTMEPDRYWSQSPNDAKRKYDTKQKERFAIVWAVLLVRPYLKSNRFSIRTSHDSLKWILNVSVRSGRLARRYLRLSGFNFDVSTAQVKASSRQRPL